MLDICIGHSGITVELNVHAFNFKCSLFHEVKNTKEGTVYFINYYKLHSTRILYFYAFIDVFTTRDCIYKTV